MYCITRLSLEFQFFFSWDYVWYNFTKQPSLQQSMLHKNQTMFCNRFFVLTTCHQHIGLSLNKIPCHFLRSSSIDSSIISSVTNWSLPIVFIGIISCRSIMDSMSVWKWHRHIITYYMPMENIIPVDRPPSSFFSNLCVIDTITALLNFDKKILWLSTIILYKMFRNQVLAFKM